MDSSKRIEIGEWENSPHSIVAKKQARRRSLPTTLLGILGTLLLHGLVIQSVSFRTRDARLKPQQMQESTLADARSATVDRLMLLSLPMISNTVETPQQSTILSILSLRSSKVKIQLQMDLPEVSGLDLLPLSEDQPTHVVAAGAEGAELARLGGIYSGQIQARIGRLWRRPRTLVNEDGSSEQAAESFACEAQIVQDTRGNVQEVMLPQCNGSPAWRHSLVDAIRHASPLPAPPNEKVFRASISLQFVGLNYFSGASDEEYQSESRASIGSE